MNEIEIYIAQFPDEVQKILEKIRKIILSEVPEAEERISYAMPGYYLNKKPLVYFAGYKNHIGFYPGASGIEEFLKEISKYKNSKGAVQFPLKEDLPIDLIKKIVAFRVNENISKNDN